MNLSKQTICIIHVKVLKEMQQKTNVVQTKQNSNGNIAFSSLFISYTDATGIPNSCLYGTELNLWEIYIA